MTNEPLLGAHNVHGMRSWIGRRRRLGILLILGVVGAAFFVSDSARAGDGEVKLTICHTAGNGKRVELTLGTPGADNHLLNHTLDRAGKCRVDCDEAAADCSEGYACIDGACIPVAPCPEDQQGIVDAISQGGAVLGCAEPTEVTTATEIIIDDNVILGGLDNLTITGDGTHRIFRVPEGVKAELIGITISGGGGVDYGGGIHNEGTLTLTDVNFSGNSAAIGGGAIYTKGNNTLVMSCLNSEPFEGDYGVPEWCDVVYGGALYVDGEAHIDNCEFTKYCARLSGGAIHVTATGSLTLNDSTVSENGPGCTVWDATSCLDYFSIYGGGISSAGTLTLNNTIVRSNNAGIPEEYNQHGSGGGIHSTGTLTVNDSSVTDNWAMGEPAGGGIYSSGPLTLTRSTVSGNFSPDGGGIAVEGGSTATLIGSTVSSNLAEITGGGISVDGGSTAMLTNSTVSSNEAYDFGGGISNGNGSSTRLVHSTLADNIGYVGSTIFNGAGTTTTMKGTIIDGHASAGFGECAGLGFVSEGYNIESPWDTCGMRGVGDQVSVSVEDLKLGAFINNGGPTPTHWPSVGSAAIDQIPGAECVADGALLLTDQRGVDRPYGGLCDVGAVEYAGGLPCTEQTIRDAIMEGGGPITFLCDRPATAWTVAEIVIDKDVILDGRGNFIADGGNDHRVFSVAPGVTAELRGFTVSGGSASYGGGIYNQGTLTLTDSTVSGNRATQYYYLAGGGGIKNEGTLTLTGSTVSGNTAVALGGGIYSWFWDGPTTLILENSEVSGNTAPLGGGIISMESAATLRDGSKVLENTAAVAAGIYTGLGTLTLTDSHVSFNEADPSLCEDFEGCSAYDGASAGGGIVNDGSNVELLRTFVSANRAGPHGVGGGIVNGSPGPNRESTMVITDSTIGGDTCGQYRCGNVAEGSLGVYAGDILPTGSGAGILNYRSGTAPVTLTLIDSAVSHNRSGPWYHDNLDAKGGGIYNDAELTLIGTWVGSNAYVYYGGGIYNDSGNVEITNSAVAGNLSNGRGGGIDSTAGTLTITGSRVEGNQGAGYFAGGIYSEGGETVVRNSSIAANMHVGIQLQGGNLTVVNSTLVDAGQLVTRCLVCLDASEANISNSTITGYDIGIVVTGGATANLKNTAISNLWGYPKGCESDEVSSVISHGYNIETQGNTCGLTAPGDQASVTLWDLKLAEASGFNGGPVVPGDPYEGLPRNPTTMALRPGSIAIDAIPLEACFDLDSQPVATDQRGWSRPQGLACDVGAVEQEDPSVIISEIMPWSSAAPGTGDYIELYNTTPNVIDLSGGALTTVWDTPMEFGPGTLINPYEYVVVAASADPAENGGIDNVIAVLPPSDCTPADASCGMGLHDTQGGAVLTDASGFILDWVTWAYGQSPHWEGEAMELSERYFNHIENDYYYSWCSATTSYGDGDYGTPGYANTCP